MNALLELGGILGIIVVGFFVWFFVAIGWLARSFGNGPNFFDNIIVFPLIVLEYFFGENN